MSTCRTRSRQTFISRLKNYLLIPPQRDDMYSESRHRQTETHRKRRPAKLFRARDPEMVEVEMLAELPVEYRSMLSIRSGFVDTETENML
jgi:hypothetical protein